MNPTSIPSQIEFINYCVAVKLAGIMGKDRQKSCQGRDVPKYTGKHLSIGNKVALAIKSSTSNYMVARTSEISGPYHGLNCTGVKVSADRLENFVD